MSQAGIAGSGGGGGTSNIQTITGTVGGAVGPDASHNINLTALYTNTVVGTPLTNTLTITPTIRGYPASPYVVGPATFAGYQTIQSAINAASLAGGGTVLIQPGTYTENLILKINVALLAVEANVDTIEVSIIGTHTPDPSNGTMTFRALNFFGTSSIFLSAAAGQGYMSFESCNWILSSNGYIFDLLNWVGPTGLTPGPNALAITNSGDLSTASSGFLRNSGGMHAALINSYIGSFVGGGGSVTMMVSGPTEISISDVYCPIQFNGGTGHFIEDCGIHGVGITFSGSSSGDVYNNGLLGLTGPAFTMSSSAQWTISSCTIDTSNNPAIAGSGSGLLKMGGNTFLTNTILANTLNVSSSVGAFPANLINNGFLLGQGPQCIIATAAPTNGQIPIGNTGSAPTINTLTAGTGVNIVNAPGNVTINSTGGGLTWNDVTAVSASMLINNGYLADNAGLVTLTLPVTVPQFAVIAVGGFGAGGWLIAQNAGQLIHVSSATSTTGVTGSVASTNRYDCIYLLCVVANTTFLALNSVGNLTVT